MKRLLIVIALALLCLSAKRTTQDEVALNRVFIIKGMNSAESWTGTGFLVRAKNDKIIILTNRHVCLNAETLFAKLAGNRPLYKPVTVLRISDTTADLCAINPGTSIDTSAGGYDVAAAVGPLPADVNIYGYPHGEGLANNSSTITTSERMESMPPTYFSGMRYYELSKPVFGGSSGSPVLNKDNELVAVICGSHQHLDGKTTGIAVPLSSIKQFLFINQ